MDVNYDADNLYKATVVDHGGIISMENVGGCIGFSSDRGPRSYETILHIQDEVIVDINNPTRIVNPEIKVPTMVMPRTSGNGHLYTVVEDSLVKCESLSEEERPLKRSIVPHRRG